MKNSNKPLLDKVIMEFEYALESIFNDRNNGEPSPNNKSRHSSINSSADSSLLIDEDSQDSEDEMEHKRNMNMRRKRQQVFFNNHDNNASIDEYLQNNHTNDGSQANQNNFNWNISNKNKPRRQRRKWLESDDIMLLHEIRQFGHQWNETPDQWNIIVSNCSFSDDFTFHDVKKHYSRVLKPKLLNQ